MPAFNDKEGRVCHLGRFLGLFRCQTVFLLIFDESNCLDQNVYPVKEKDTITNSIFDVPNILFWSAMKNE